MAPGPRRVDAACRVAGGEREGLRGELPCGGLADGAQTGVREDRGPVPQAQFAQRRIRGRGVGAQQFGELRVGCRGVHATPGVLGVVPAVPVIPAAPAEAAVRAVPGVPVFSVGPAGPSHPRASSHPVLSARRCPGVPAGTGVPIVVEGNLWGKRFPGVTAAAAKL